MPAVGATEAAIITLVIIVIAVGAKRWTKRRKNKFCGNAGPFPPYNIGLYDYPYFYPNYEGRAAVRWDGDKRCTANCTQSPCTVWCR